jgi:hypothetical protein
MRLKNPPFSWEKATEVSKRQIARVSILFIYIMVKNVKNKDAKLQKISNLARKIGLLTIEKPNYCHFVSFFFWHKD